jgi:hypothetical protein
MLTQSERVEQDMRMALEVFARSGTWNEVRAGHESCYSHVLWRFYGVNCLYSYHLSNERS